MGLLTHPPWGQGLETETRERGRPTKSSSRYYLSIALGTQTQLDGSNGRLGAVGNPELEDDAAHVLLYGARADQEILGDLLVGASSRKQLQDLDLAPRQRRG